MKNILPSIWTACALACFVELASAAVQPQMELRPDAQVDGQGVYLDQIVSATNVVHLRLGNAPAFGAAAVLTRAQVSELIQKNAPDWASTNWTGAAKIKITRQSRPFPEDELCSMLTGALQREYARDRGQVEIRVTRPWQTLSMPSESLTLRIIDMPANGLTPNCVVRFEVRCGQELMGTWSMPLEAHLWREVWVAQSPLRRGDRLQTSDLSRERRDILTLRETFASSSIDDASLELTENLPVGSPLLARSVRAKPVVQRGKLVDAIVQDGALVISAKVMALEDGLAGQTIRVRNSKSGREFRGKVQNEQTIQVSL